MFAYSVSYAVDAPAKNKKNLNRYIFKILIRGDDGENYTATGFKLKSRNGIIAPLHCFFKNIRFPGTNLVNYKVVAIVSLLTGDTIWNNTAVKYRFWTAKVTELDTLKDVCFINYGFKHDLFDDLYANEGFELDSLATIEGNISRNAVIIYNPMIDIGGMDDFILKEYVPFSKIAVKCEDIANSHIPALNQYGFYISVRDLHQGNSGSPILSSSNPSKVIGMFGYGTDRNNSHYGVLLKGLKLQKPTQSSIKALAEAHSKIHGTNYKSGDYRECSDILYDGDNTKKLSVDVYWTNILNINCVFLLRKFVDTTLMETNYYKEFWNYYSYYYLPRGKPTNAQTRINQSQFEFPLFYSLLNVHAAGYKYYGNSSPQNREKLLQCLASLDSLISNDHISNNEIKMYRSKKTLIKDMREVFYYYKERLNRENPEERPLSYLPTYADKINYLDNSSLSNEVEKDNIKKEVDSLQSTLQYSFLTNVNESMSFLMGDSIDLAVESAMDAILADPLDDFGYNLLDSLKKRSSNRTDFNSIFNKLPLLQNAVFMACINRSLLLKTPLPRIEFVNSPTHRIDGDAILIPLGKLRNDYLNIAYAPYPLGVYDPPQAYVIGEMLFKYTVCINRILKGVANDVSFSIISEGHADGVPYNKPLLFIGSDFSSGNLDKEKFLNIENGQTLSFEDVKKGTSKQKNLALAFLRALFPLTQIFDNKIPRATKEIIVEAHDHPGDEFRYLLLSIKCNYVRK